MRCQLVATGSASDWPPPNGRAGQARVAAVQAPDVASASALQPVHTQDCALCARLMWAQDDRNRSCVTHAAHALEHAVTATRACRRARGHQHLQAQKRQADLCTFTKSTSRQLVHQRTLRSVRTRRAPVSGLYACIAATSVCSRRAVHRQRCPSLSVSMAGAAGARLAAARGRVTSRRRRRTGRRGCRSR